MKRGSKNCEMTNVYILSPCGGLSNGISSHCWVRGGYKSFSFFFFAVFFSWLRGAHKSMLFFGGLGM
jgi:hypothetical protein